MAWDFSALRLHVVPDSRTVQVAGSQFYQLPLWFTRDQALAVTSCDSKCPPRLLVRKCPHLASPALGPLHAIAVTEPRSVTATLAVIPGRGGRCVLLWRPLASVPVDSGAAPS